MYLLFIFYVVVCGGNIFYSGFINRLYKEFIEDYFFFIKIIVWVGFNRNFSVWLGAFVVVYLFIYKFEWMIKDEYDESLR